MTFQRFQVSKLCGGLPKYSHATITGTPYVGTGVWVGDTLDLSPATTTAGFPIPSPLYTQTLTANGTSKGDATTYTVVVGDIGSSFVVTQTSQNAYGLVSAASNTVTPIAALKPWDLGMVGINCSNPTSFTRVQFLNNAGQAGGTFRVYNNTSVNYSGPLDANGWPTQTFALLLTSTLVGDGQIAAGTYQCSFRSTGQATNIVPATSTGCTVSNISQDADGITTHFQVVIPFAANAILSFDGGVQYVDVPRDGVTPTWGGPEFWSTNLAFMSNFSRLRLMDLCYANNVNGTLAGNGWSSAGAEIVWADRNTLRPEYSVTQPATAYSWERICRFIKAVAQYPGSRTKEVWINPPGVVDLSQPNVSNYAYQLVRVVDSILSGVNVSLRIEGGGNEQWNNQFVQVVANRVTATVETKAILGYPLGGGVTVNLVSSVVSNGDGTATVTLTSPLNAVPLPDGSTFAITNGMAMIMNHQTLNTTWGAGGVVPDPTFAGDGTVTTVNVTVPSPTGTTFTYPINGGVGVTVGTTLAAVSNSNQFAFFFNTASNLIKDGWSLNFFQMGHKVYVRRAYQYATIWHAVRPQDKFHLGVQTYGGNGIGIVNTAPSEFPYSKYIGGGSNAWCDGVAVAPYMTATGIPFTGVAASGGTTVTGVPWAASAQVGDTIKIAGAGTAGATLTTTVVSGSGTTLTVADTISTTSTASIISYSACAQASFTGSISGNVLTVTAISAGTILPGMLTNGTPVALAYGTQIDHQLTGTAGSTGTYQLTASQANVASTSMVFAQTDGLVAAMASNQAAFSAQLVSHIYTCKRYGLTPLVYEGGPDTQAFPNQQVAIHSNPNLQAVVSTLLDNWFNLGGDGFQFFFGAPTPFSNLAQGGWSALQSYTDTTSPKYAALVGYASKVLAPAGPNGSPGSFGPTGTSGSYVQSTTQEQLNMTFNSVNGMLYGSSGNATERILGTSFVFPRARRWGIQAKGSDSVAGTTADVYLDAVMVGTITFPQNGSAASNGTVPGDSTILQLGELTAGAHNIKLDFPVGRGTNVGVFSITPVKY